MVVVVGVVGVVAFSAPASADAAAVYKSCGGKRIQHDIYSISARAMSCKRARQWTERYIRRHVKPKGWKCSSGGCADLSSNAAFIWFRPFDRDLATNDARTARGKPCVDRYNDGRCKVKPGRWGAGAHAEVRSIKWSHWGNRKAVGRGRIHYAPGGDGGPGVVKLSKLKSCGSGQRRYTKIKVIFVDYSPYSYGYRSGC